MQKASFFIFITILVLCLAGYFFLHMRQGSNTGPASQTVNALVADTNVHSSWTTSSLSIDEKKETQLHFDMPELWRADLKRPAFLDQAVSQGVFLHLTAPDSNVSFEVFTPTKFRYFEGVLGQYLSPQQEPLTPTEIMTEFFNFKAGQFTAMERPEIEIQASKKGMEQYYYNEKQQWFLTTTEFHKKYYWISTEKSPTPGVYGNLGTWNFFGGILSLPHSASLSDHLPQFHKVYRSMEIERRSKEDKS